MNLTKRFLVGIVGLSIIICLVLFCSAPRAFSFKLPDGTDFVPPDGAELVYDDGTIAVFADPTHHGEEYGKDADAKAPAKAKNNVTVTSYSSTPSIVETCFPESHMVFHWCYFHLKNRDDNVKVKFKAWRGSWGLRWNSGWFPATKMTKYWVVFSTTGYTYWPGFWNLKSTVVPQTNKTGGKSSTQCRFHIY